MLSAFDAARNNAVEILPVPESVGRILAEPVTAQCCSPHFHAAAMDGIAVSAETTFGAHESTPRTLSVGTEAFYVNTGHPLPEGTNAVIMIEHVQSPSENQVVIEAPAFPWQHVRKMGEDIVATEMLFPQNHRITPYCIGALLAAGIFEVCVRKAPEALIIPTGSELVDCNATDPCNLKPGQVIESNSHVIGNLIKACGGTFERNAILSDDLDILRRTVKQAAESNYDLVLMIGGSSAGSADFTRRVIEDLGTVLIHGVAMMPGKPVVIGKVNHKPVIGLPGYPVSAIIAFEQLVQPLICRMLSQQEPERNRTPVNPARKIPSKLGTEEFVRVKLGRVGDRVVASPLPRGSGTITSLTQADGIIRISELVEGINAHETVEAELLKPLSAVCNTVMVVGSHDNCLDVLADELHRQFPAQSLASNHVGSMGGLLALKRRVAHMAGCHLLDESDGSYNLSYVQKYLPGIPVKIVRLVHREQGLIVSPGNPRSIESIGDLTRKGIRFINRQAGSGTRILLDYHLKQSGIDPQSINGYALEEFTHMNVAVAVLSNAVDAGLGIYAAARALGLDFIPVATEEYDLVIPRVHFETPMIQNLLSVLHSPSFQKRVQAMGGYRLDDMGKLKAEF